jgi:hypothetical protein
MLGGKESETTLRGIQEVAAQIGQDGMKVITETFSRYRELLKGEALPSDLEDAVVVTATSLELQREYGTSPLPGAKDAKKLPSGVGIKGKPISIALIRSIEKD